MNQKNDILNIPILGVGTLISDSTTITNTILHAL